MKPWEKNILNFVNFAVKVKMAVRVPRSMQIKVNAGHLKSFKNVNNQKLKAGVGHIAAITGFAFILLLRDMPSGHQHMTSLEFVYKSTHFCVLLYTDFNDVICWCPEGI